MLLKFLVGGYVLAIFFISLGLVVEQFEEGQGEDNSDWFEAGGTPPGSDILIFIGFFGGAVGVAATLIEAVEFASRVLADFRIL